MDIENWKDVVRDRDGCRDIVVADKTLRVDMQRKEEDNGMNLSKCIPYK